MTPAALYIYKGIFIGYYFERQKMKLSDFQYELPKRLIAQNPAAERTGSRLMVVDRKSGRVIHDQFINLKSYLNAGDCLVFNDTRVMPARLFGRKAAKTTAGCAEGAGCNNKNALGASGASGALAEALLLHESGGGNTDSTIWEAIVRPGKKLLKGAVIIFGGGLMKAEIIEVMPMGHRLLRFDCANAELLANMEKIGRTPFPPYIKNSGANPERYQTVYSKTAGSAAAPTAGLHFSEQYLAGLTDAGILSAYLTLHIGPGTFAPVKTEVIEEHKMHSEYYIVSKSAAETVNSVKNASFMNIYRSAEKGVKNTAGCAPFNDIRVKYNDTGAPPKVICVGTTSMRTLESVAGDDGMIKHCDGWTDIFIYPGFQFKCADALLTNFHLPGSTLLMLVSAFAGYDLIMDAYQQAVGQEYRFFSFGDAMLIL